MDVPTENLRCWAEIDLSALRHNAAVVCRLAGPGAGVMAIVKANAYGHGLPGVVRALRDMVAMYGVANVHEAQAVRAALGTDAAGAPGIFILGPALPGERPEIVEGEFVPAISTLREAAAYSALGHGKPVPIHLAIDTGMGRMGIAEEEALEMIREIVRMPDLVIAGVATHLPVADEDEQYTGDQLARFEGLLAAIRELGVDTPCVHSLNSAGIFRFPSHAGALVQGGGQSQAWPFIPTLPLLPSQRGAMDAVCGSAPRFQPASSFGFAGPGWPLLWGKGNERASENLGGLE